MRSQKTSQLQKDLKTCEIPIDPFSKNGREFHSEMVAVQLRGRDQGRRAKRVIKHWMRKGLVTVKVGVVAGRPDNMFADIRGTWRTIYCAL